MAELEIETHKVAQAEHEFYRAFVVILEHLKNRAINAELEVAALRKERDALAERIEVLLTSHIPDMGNDRAKT